MRPATEIDRRFVHAAYLTKAKLEREERTKRAQEEFLRKEEIRKEEISRAAVSATAMEGEAGSAGAEGGILAKAQVASAVASATAVELQSADLSDRAEMAEVAERADAVEVAEVAVEGHDHASRAAIHAIFHEFDKDGNGTIDSSELLTALRALGMKTSRAEAKQALLRYDADLSGAIDLDEFTRLIEALQAFQVWKTLIRSLAPPALLRLFRHTSGASSVHASTPRLRRAATGIRCQGAFLRCGIPHG